MDQQTAGHDIRQTTDDKAHGQRRDKGVDPQPGDQAPVGEAQYETDKYARGQAQRRVALSGNQRRCRPGSRKDRAGGKVKAPADNRHRCTQSDQAHLRRLVENVQHIPGGEEGRCQQTQGDKDREKGQDNTIFA